MFNRIRAAWRALWKSTAAPIVVAEGAEPQEDPRVHDGFRISDSALWEAKRHNAPILTPREIFKRPTPPKGMMAAMGYDALPEFDMAYAGQYASMVSEGLGFMGYQYLAELSQRAEYRKMAQIIADHCVRKWIKFTGDEAKLIELEREFERLGVKEIMRSAIELEGYLGRIQIFADFGDYADMAELRTPLKLEPEKISPKRPLKNLKIIQPLWSYPGIYEAQNPLHPLFYKPREWFVSGYVVHDSRLATIVSNEMPDMLKPAYAFGGVSLAQMAKPYVDNWLRNRQAGSDILNAFTTWKLQTNMEQVLQGDTIATMELFKRTKLFTDTASNHGVFVLDKSSEDFDNVSAPITGVSDLVAQSQEHMSSVSSIPLVLLTGITPAGLNASSDGEIRVFYDTILAKCEKDLRGPIEWISAMVQLSRFGEIDPDIKFEFVSLWEMSDKDKADIRKSNADAAAVYIASGVVSPEEDRERLNNEDGGMYAGTLTGPAPEVEDGGEEEELVEA